MSEAALAILLAVVFLSLGGWLALPFKISNIEVHLKEIAKALKDKGE